MSHLLAYDTTRILTTYRFHYTTGIEPIRQQVRKLENLFRREPFLNLFVKHVAFEGFANFDADRHVLSTLVPYSNLVSLVVPWGAFRVGRADHWKSILDKGLVSLQLTGREYYFSEMEAIRKLRVRSVLEWPGLSLHQLRNLQIEANARRLPAKIGDLKLMAKTATNLTTLILHEATTASMVAIVEASCKTLTTIEYTLHDRSDLHSGDAHVCEALSHCLKLRFLKLEVKHVCDLIFPRERVHRGGEFSLQAEAFCDGAKTREGRDMDIWLFLDSASESVGKDECMAEKRPFEISISKLSSCILLNMLAD